MATNVGQKQRALAVIKSDAAAANSVPALRDQVAILTDEVQKLKDVLLGKEKVQDD